MANASGTDRPAHPPRFVVGDWQVDAGANRLRREDVEVKLESKVVAVLSYLAEHHGELVTREALERGVWGRTVVGYDAVTGSIAKLRKVLGDNPRDPRYIETISKKGYRLIAPVSSAAHRADAEASPQPSNTPRTRRVLTRFPSSRAVVASVLVLGLVVAGALRVLLTDGDAAPAADRASIVVLPFTNLGGDPRQTYFSDGVTADITTALSKLSGLFVISPSSAMDLRNRRRDSKQIAASLGVRYVLDGNVRRTGDRLRVNANLIDASQDVYLWSEKYDRKVGDVFEVQDDITTNIVHALSIQLTEAERRHTARKYTTRVDAYDDFLRGQSLYFRHNPEDNRLARDYYQQAIDRDPSFARAYSAMALTYVAEHRYGWGRSATGQVDRALQLATRGVALDAELPQAHWVLGYVHVFRKEYGQAAAAAGRAVQLDPNFADSYITLAVCQLHFGKPEEALRLIRKAMLLNPESPVAYSSILAQAHYFMGHYDRAVAVLREALDRNATLPTMHVFLIAALSELNRMDEAMWAAEQFRVIAPQFTVDSVTEMLAVQDTRAVEAIKGNLRRAGL